MYPFFTTRRRTTFVPSSSWTVSGAASANAFGDHLSSYPGPVAGSVSVDTGVSFTSTWSCPPASTGA